MSSSFWPVMTVLSLLLQRKAEYLILEERQEVHPQISVSLWDPTTANSSSSQMELKEEQEFGMSVCSLVDKRAMGSCGRAEPSVRSDVATQNI